MTARLRALVGDDDVELGVPFACVHPGHGGCMALTFIHGGHWRYECEAGCRVGMLGEIRGRVAYEDADRHISKVEGARWGELLDYEAGLLDPGPPWPVPDGAPASVRRVIQGLGLFLGLRAAGGKFLDEEFTFTREIAPRTPDDPHARLPAVLGFGVAYCGYPTDVDGVTQDQFRHAMHLIERRYKLIERVGKSRRPIVWRAT